MQKKIKTRKKKCKMTTERYGYMTAFTEPVTPAFKSF